MVITQDILPQNEGREVITEISAVTKDEIKKALRTMRGVKYLGEDGIIVDLI